MAKKKTIKFKGIEWKECSSEKWFAAESKDGYARFVIEDEEYYFMPKRKRCSKCGHVLKAGEE